MHDARVALRDVVARVGPEAVLLHVARAEHAAAARAVVEPRHAHDVGSAERSAGRRQLAASHAVERPHVHRAREREVAEQRARRAVDDVDVANAAGEEHREIVVPLGVAVHRLVHRHAVHPERDVGRVVGAEAAQRNVGAEARTLTLLMDLEPGRLAEQLVGRRGGRQPNRRRVDRRRRHRLRTLGGRGDDGDGLEARGGVGARGTVSGVRRVLRGERRRDAEDERAREMS